MSVINKFYSIKMDVPLSEYNELADKYNDLLSKQLHISEGKVSDTLYQIQCDLPGFSLDEIIIAIYNRYQLTIVAEKKVDEKFFYRRPIEIEYKLPKCIRSEEITASLHLGVLTVNIPIYEDIRYVSIHEGKN